jgi:hypothetical protein
MRRRRIVGRAALVLILLGALAVWWNSDTERRWGWIGNNRAFCWNASSFLRHAMEDYATEHDGWFPKGGSAPLDSLVVLTNYWRVSVYDLTSHALGGALNGYYQKYHIISPELSCYRYNEGLRIEDSGDLIVMYYYKPTRWSDHNCKGNVLGRQVLSPRMEWSFIPDAEFQVRQKKTEALLQKRSNRADEIAFVESNLIVTVVCTNSVPNTFHFLAYIQNKSSDAATFLLFEPARLMISRGPAGLKDIENEGVSISIPAHESRPLSGWYHLFISNRVCDGKVVYESMKATSCSGSKEADGSPRTYDSTQQGYLKPGIDLSNYNANCSAQVVLRGTVIIGNIRDLEVVLKSEKLRYYEAK